MTLHQFDVLMTIMAALARRYSGAVVNQRVFDAPTVAANEIVVANQGRAVKVVDDDEPTMCLTPDEEAA